jgi:hypothetical protein
LPGAPAPDRPTNTPPTPAVPPMGTPPKPSAKESPPAPQKAPRPSIFFMILDFLVFGGAVALTVLLFLQP